jgi:hypothetical protein
MAPGPPPPAPGGPKPRNPSARKPSPPRPDGSDAEKTFQQKLDEIKRLRANTSTIPAPEPERRRVIVNGKPSLAISGDWALFASSSGRQYYFNLKSLVNQWHRPPEWCDATTKNTSAKGNEAKATPPLPPQSSSGNNRPPPPPQPTQAALEASNGSGHPTTFKMKIKSKSKHKMKENLTLNTLDDEAVQENGETNRLPPGALYEEVDHPVSPKRSRRDSSRSSYSSRSRSRSRSSRSHSRSSRSYSSRSSRSSSR